MFDLWDVSVTATSLTSRVKSFFTIVVVNRLAPTYDWTLYCRCMTQRTRLKSDNRFCKLANQSVSFFTRLIFNSVKLETHHWKLFVAPGKRKRKSALHDGLVVAVTTVCSYGRPEQRRNCRFQIHQVRSLRRIKRFREVPTSTMRPLVSDDDSKRFLDLPVFCNPLRTSVFLWSTQR